MNGFVLGLVLVWLTIVIGAWLGWQLLRQNGRMLLRLDELEKRLDGLEFGTGEEPAGLPVGSEAPEFELADLAGETRTLAQYRGMPVLLIFFNPACGFCRELLPKLAVPSPSPPPEERDGERRPHIVIVSTGEAEANRHLFNEHEVTCPVLLQEKAEVAAAYKANGTPSGYLISADGKIASELAMGADALLALLDRKVESKKQEAEMKNGLLSPTLSSRRGEGEHERNHRFKERSLARSKIKRDGLRSGTVAPDFRLPRLDGRGDLALSDLRGSRVLLVFSSPGCGPCNTLAPQLEQFHRDYPELEVVMISKGEPKENRVKVKEHGLTFPVVLQQQWEISRRYAMFATPIAYFIDERGIVAQDVAVGPDAILGLMFAQNGHAAAFNPLR
jgi:peroxiredoxin